MASSDLHENAPHVSVTEARQGNRGRHILIVLVVSIVLAGVALAAAWSWRAGDFHRVDSNTASRIAAGAPTPAATSATPPQNPASTGLNRQPSGQP